jgi:magnesium transporter
MREAKEPFAERRRLMTVRQDVMEVARQIRANLAPEKEAQLRAVLQAYHPADLADAMLFLSEQEDAAVFQALDTAEAAEVLDEVDAATEARLVGITRPDRLADIVEELPPDEGADILGGLPKDKAEQALALTDAEKAREIRTLLAYPKNTAGGIMSLGYVDVPEMATQADALARFREKQDAEQIFFLYIVDAQGGLCGTVDLHTLLSADPTTPVRDVMEEAVITVPPGCDQEQVAHIFARYDLTALPVVGDAPECRLLGVITADDIIDVIREEANEDLALMSGSDAQELERKSPAQVARLRLPWIMATMFIELLAGFVIHDFDRTLTRYILLASFMPIISAISGNTGLQSAAIIIRGLSTGHVRLAHWRHAVLRQLTTTALLGGACALVLGIIGGLWARDWVFGLTVFLGMFLAVNIAGIVGTIVPLLSKRAGFDPALTAGPFETAFQDVIGISIFLSLATLLLRWLH